MNNQYSPEGLDRLYQAIVQQAENDVLEALHRDYPDLTAEQETAAMNKYRTVRHMAEQRIIDAALVKQGRGK